jgi:hypothetical protein
MLAMNILNYFNTTNIASTYATTERILDMLGYIPGLSSISALVRLNVAVTEILHATFLLVFAFLNYFFFIQNKSSTRKIIKDSMELFKNSIFNFIRAQVEFFPAFGSLFCLIYDCTKSQLRTNQLSAIFGYSVIDQEIHRPFITKLID